MSKITSLNNNRKLLLIIIIIASILRLWKIDEVPVSLFSDELDVGYQADSLIKTGKDYMGNPFPLYFHSYADFRAPVYIYSAIPTVFLFGITPLGVRLPAVIFGILGVWAIYLLVTELLSYKIIKIGRNQSPISNHQSLAIVASAIMAISPWHLQYSRAAFEVTEVFFFLLMGLYFFFKGLRNGMYFWISAICFGLTPWIYSTARFFVPFLILFLFIVWKKEIISCTKKYLITTVAVLGVFFLPMFYTMLTGSAGQRFSYISIFSDPTVPGEVEFAKLTDARVEGENRSLFSKIESGLIHNKYTFWGRKIVENYYKSFSTEFLFIKGDINLRHSIEGVGQLYKVEAIALVLGIISFFGFFKDKKIKLLIAFWILVGTLPSAITRDGGGHATRLILILPPLVLLISYGILQGFGLFGGQWVKPVTALYIGLLVINFWTYQHEYWVENPWYSERSWHAGYGPMVELIKKYEGNYKKIIISNAEDQPYIFFAVYYPVPPDRWQMGFSEGHVEGFGDMKHLGKIYFGQVGSVGLKGLSDVLEEGTLYIAAQREWKSNLIREPQTAPEGLKLIDLVAYPSGEPAFYLFSGKN